MMAFFNTKHRTQKKLPKKVALERDLEIKNMENCQDKKSERVDQTTKDGINVH